MYTLEEIQRYILSRRPSGVIVDTNILLLLLIGHFDKDFIKNYSLFKNNAKNYTKEDFELLKQLVSYFNKLIITPQIIAELSNISITSNRSTFGSRLLSYLQAVVDILKDAEEHHQQAECLWGMQLEVLSRFGFTDVTISELSKRTHMPILTDELELYLYLVNNGIPAISFEYIKNSQARLTLV